MTAVCTFEARHPRSADGYQQRPRDWRKRASISAGRLFNGAAKERSQPIKALIGRLNICPSASHWDEGQKREVRGRLPTERKECARTYFLPFACHPSVMSAFCSLARADGGGALVGVAQILSDPSGAF